MSDDVRRERVCMYEQNTRFQLLGRGNLFPVYRGKVQKKDETTKKKDGYFTVILLTFRLLQGLELPQPQPAAVSHAPEAHALHDGRKCPVGHHSGLLARPETGQLERPPLQPLVVEEEAVAVPAQELHHLAGLAEEDEDVAVQQRTPQLTGHQLGQPVDPQVHAHVALAHIIPPAGL